MQRALPLAEGEGSLKTENRSPDRLSGLLRWEVGATLWDSAPIPALTTRLPSRCLPRVCTRPGVQIHDRQGPTHLELTLGRDRQTRKQFQTLTRSVKTKGSCGWAGGCLEGNGGKVIEELATANGLGLVRQEFASVTIYRVSTNTIIHYRVSLNI